MGKYDIEVKNVAPTIWVYKDSKGETREREQSQEERDEQTVPPRGEYVFKIKAFSVPFEMQRSEKFGGGTQQMTRLLLEVVEGPSKKVQGQFTTVLCTWSISARSNLGRVWQAATGLPFPQGMADPELMLEREFSVYAVQDKLDDNGNRKSTSLSWDTVGPAGDQAEGDEEDDFEN